MEIFNEVTTQINSLDSNFIENGKIFSVIILFNERDYQWSKKKRLSFWYNQYDLIALKRFPKCIWIQVWNFTSEKFHFIGIRLIFIFRFLIMQCNSFPKQTKWIMWANFMEKWTVQLKNCYFYQNRFFHLSILNLWSVLIDYVSKFKCVWLRKWTKMGNNTYYFLSFWTNCLICSVFRHQICSLSIGFKRFILY